MKILSSSKRKHGIAALAMLLACATQARAFEHVTLSNGFELDCVRRVVSGDKVRLYFAPSAASPDNFLELPAIAIVKIETLPDPPAPPMPALTVALPAVIAAQPSPLELHEMLSRAGAAHHIDADLLASVVNAESGGHNRAVSRTGARGLMQLMPGTAASLGVKDSFAPAQNVEGGTTYLDALLTRYHDNIALALAAYNAGPGAVDRFRGVPPFRETRAYVARIIREFNRRKTTLIAKAEPLPTK